MSTETTYAQQHGYSDAMKNIEVSAIAVPLGTVDTNEWIQSIKTALDKEGKLEFPSTGSFKDAEIKIPTAPDVERPKPLEPPSSCFKSYAEWQQYKKDREADKKKDQSDAQIREEAKKSEGETLPTLEEALNETTSIDYRNFHKELKSIKANKYVKNYGIPIQDIRINNRIVVGFDATSYSQVLPQLRPDLSIPGKFFEFEQFPNLSRLLIINTNLSKLSAYINFMANFSISGLADITLTTKFDSFVSEFLAESNDLISDYLKLGIDIDKNIMKGLLGKYFGSLDRDYEKCLLYKYMGESAQIYKYIIFLLKPNAQRIWMEAPGGYINTMWVKTGATNAYAIPQYVGSMGSVDRKRDFCECELLNWIDPGANPLDTLFPKTAQSPLYPIFVYTVTGNPKLYFLQIIKNMQFVLTAEDAQFSGPVDYQSVAFLKDNPDNPDNPDKPVEPKKIVGKNEKIKDDKKFFKFDDSKSGFSLSEKDHTWDYGLNFSFLKESEEIKMNTTDRNQVLVLTNFNQSTFDNGYSCQRSFINPKDGLSRLSFIEKPNNECLISDQPCLILFPIKSGEYNATGVNSQAFSMHSDYGPEQIIASSVFSHAIDLALIK